MEKKVKFSLVKPLHRHLFDSDALKVLCRLQRQGFVAYFVGGCVRDLLLGLSPKDFDIATSARPRQVRRLFKNSRVIGRRFLLANVQFGNKVIEVSTFRQTPWKNGVPAEDLLINQDNVFGSDEDDALRRDFTINALFYDPEKRVVVDYVDGLDDLQNGTIRTIGDPWVRLREDPIRIIRALKLSARLGFDILPELLEALKGCRYDLNKSAPARLLLELLKILRDGSSLKCFQYMEQCGVLEVILPLVKKYLMGAHICIEENKPATLFKAYLSGVDSISYEKRLQLSEVVLLSILFHPLLLSVLTHQNKSSKKPKNIDQMMEEILDSLSNRLNLSRKNRERAKQIVMVQNCFEQPYDSVSVKSIIEEDCFLEALHLFQLKCIGTNLHWDILNFWMNRYQ